MSILSHGVSPLGRFGFPIELEDGTAMVTSLDFQEFPTFGGDCTDLHSAHLDRAFSAFIVRLDWGSRSASIRVARDAEQLEHLSLQRGQLGLKGS